MLTDDQIQATVFAVLRKWKDDRAWDRYTRESGPYDVASLRPEVLEIIRAVLAVAPVIPQGYCAVPIKKLVKIAGLIDPAPVEVDGKLMVFKNPVAAEVLTRLSAEVRELIERRAPDAGLPVSAGQVDGGDGGALGATDAERAAWLADKIVAQGDYAKEAAAMLQRWPDGAKEADCG